MFILSLGDFTEYCDKLAKIKLQSSTSAVVVHSRGISLLFCFQEIKPGSFLITLHFVDRTIF